eukprot:862689-Pleurochrysis_carterae.AAC.4
MASGRWSPQDQCMCCRESTWDTETGSVYCPMGTACRRCPEQRIATPRCEEADCHHSPKRSTHEPRVKTRWRDWRTLQGVPVPEREPISAIHRVLVDVEWLDSDRRRMVPARRALPRELHVNATAAAAFDLNATHSKGVVSARYVDGAWRCGRGERRALARHEGLRQEGPLVAEVGERLALRHSRHAAEQIAQRRVGGRRTLHHAAVATGLHWEGERARTTVSQASGGKSRRIANEFGAVVAVVKVQRPVAINVDLRPVEFVRSCAHKRPESGVCALPLASVDAGLNDVRRVRLPLCRLEQGPVLLRAKEAEQRRDAPDRLAVAWHDAVPNAPHVLPRLDARPVEPRRLDVTCLALCPPVAHVCHELAAADELETVDPWRRAAQVPVAPPHRGPVERGIGPAKLRLQSDGIRSIDCSIPE